MRTVYFFLAVLLLAPWAAAQDASRSTAALRQELDNVARVGSVMVDGDVCQKILTPLAREYMFKVDPQNQFLAGDNYDVDDVAFNTTKKMLIRLSHLAPFPADVNLWMPIEGHPGKIQIVVRNKNEISQFWRWGAIVQEVPAPMATVLKTGQRVAVTDRPGLVSVLAPVYNSLGDIVGVLEAVSRANIDAHENVK